jgi:hypothetical protein
MKKLLLLLLITFTLGLSPAKAYYDASSDDPSAVEILEKITNALEELVNDGITMDECKSLIEKRNIIEKELTKLRIFPELNKLKILYLESKLRSLLLQKKEYLFCLYWVGEELENNSDRSQRRRNIEI